MNRRSDKPRFRRGATVQLTELDRALDVPVPAWDRTVRRLVREFRSKRISLELPTPRAAAAGASPNVVWTGLFEAQVRRLPRMDRAEEFRMARRYEFAKARVVDALQQAGYRSPEDLVLRPFRDLPEPERKRPRTNIDYLKTCVEELEQLRNLYLEGSLYLVPGPVRRYRGLGVEESDLIQEGNASLFQAIEGFDWRRDVRFKTYAIYWIQQAILKTLYNSSRTVRIPIWVQKAYRKIQRLRDASRSENGTELTSRDVGDQLDMPENRVEAILGVRRFAVSLDAARTDGDGFTLGQLLPDDRAMPVHESIEDVDLQGRLDAVLSELPDRERDILIRRYGMYGREAETLAVIGQDMGITAERVRQLQQAALTRLQKPQRIEKLRALGELN